MINSHEDKYGGREQEYEGTDRNPDKNKCNVNHLKSSSKIASLLRHQQRNKFLWTQATKHN